MKAIIKHKIKIVDDDGVEEVYRIGRKETMTKETLNELSNNQGSDEDVEQ